MSKLQNEDFKSAAQLVSGGGTAAQLLNDTKIYVTARSLNKSLFQAITDGNIGGGGGGSLQWVESADSPISEIENNVLVYRFEDTVSQFLYALVKVPNTYSGGSQINLRFLMYSPSTSGTGLLQTLSTLLTKDSSAITSTTNQRTSTNAAVTFSVTANRIRTVTCDLTDSTGNINGVPVTANDLIQVRLTRDTTTDTDTADLRALVYGAEVTFQ